MTELKNCDIVISNERRLAIHKGSSGGTDMAEILKNTWANYLNEEFEKEYYQKLRKFLACKGSIQ